MKKEALFYRTINDEQVQCTLCPRGCVLEDAQYGYCGVRYQEGGTLYTNTYGRCSGVHLDPMEKKPLNHYKPGTLVLSVGGVGCTFDCRFCQNHHLLDSAYPTEFVPPEALVEMALNAPNCSGIAFTYNEPTLQIEYILDTAALAKEKGLCIVMVTNGFIQQEPLQVLLDCVDAMNIDLKGFTERYYRDLCQGHLDAVLKCIKAAYGKTHIELTYLALPHHNTALHDFRRALDWIRAIDREIPLHISRYFPNYQMTDLPTPLSLLFDLKSTADQYLSHVYLGNVGGADDTIHCPNCHGQIDLHHPKLTHRQIKPLCPSCGHPLYIVL